MILTHHGIDSLRRLQPPIYVPGPIIDGRQYTAVKIGSVIVTAENLDYKYPGIPIGANIFSYSSPAANYYNNSESTFGVNGNKYGLLYNWPALNIIEQNKNSVFPGWHVITKEDAEKIILYINESGNALKSTTGWANGNDGLNTYGFNAQPAGVKSDTFYELTTYGNFWTSTEFNAYNAYRFYFSQTDSINYNTYKEKNRQMSIRLVKD